jgi:hypothetical protein
MRKVFTKSSDVIDLFVNKEQSEARCRNVFFNDNKRIFSYGTHCELARFMDDNTLLINNTSYSRTTNKHVRQVANEADRLGLRIIYSRDTDVNLLKHKIVLNIDRLKRARKPHAYIHIINDHLAAFDSYVEYNSTLPLVHEDRKIFSGKDELVYNSVVDMVKLVNNPEEKPVVDKKKATKRAEMKELQELMDF